MSGEKNKRSWMFLFLLLSLFIAILPYTWANLSCSIASTCTNDILLHISATTNAHAELTNESNYNYYVCCSSAESLATSCSGNYVSFLTLSSSTNAHVEDPGQGNYGYNACISTPTWKDCSIATSCPSGYSCLASISDLTNAHIGDCSSYSYKVCCYVNARPTQSTPTLTSDDSQNTTLANLTCQNVSTSDPDGDNVYNTFIWYRNNAPIENLVLPFDRNISSGEVPDYSGYGNNATLGGGTQSKIPTWTTGKIGGAYNFDGTDDYMSIQDSNSLDLTNEMTIVAWIKADTFRTPSNGEVGNIISKQSSSTNGWFIGVGNNTATQGKLVFGVLTSSWHKIDSSSTTLSTGTWYFVAATVNSSYIGIYVNGSLVNSISGSFGSISTNTYNIEIGADLDFSTSNYHAFDGIIDNIRIFNKSLSAEQILQIYNEEKQGYSSSSTLKYKETQQGETWKCKVIPIDGKDAGIGKFSNSITIQNTPPSITTPTISPDPAYTDSSLSCSVTVTDPDTEQSLSVNFTWYNGSTYYSSEVISGNSGDTLTSYLTPSGVQQKHETWKCIARAYDGIDYSTQKEANITIQNSPPTTPTLSQPANGSTLTSRTPTFTWSSTDKDNDPITYDFELDITNGVCNNLPYSTSTSSTSFTLPFELCVDKTYTWRVRARDNENAASSWSQNYTFDVISWIDVKLTTSTVDFGTLQINQNDDTTDNSPPPLVIENNGNININVKVRAEDPLWVRAALNTSYFRIKADQTSEINSFNYSGSITSWTNVPDSYIILIRDLDWHNSSDSAEADLYVLVPPDEPPGNKNSTLTFLGEAS